ncbi:MAG: hypothetical protein V1873_01330, partial [Verrucomicrobiota bacterium]
NAAATNTDGLRGWISPNLDLVNPAGVTQVTDWIVPATNLFAREGNGMLSVTVVVQNISFINYNNNTTGVWRFQLSADDYDFDRGWRVLTNAGGIVTTCSWDRQACFDQWIPFTVYDDDTNYPAFTSNAFTRPLGVTLNSSVIAGSDTTTNALFTVTDQQLAFVGGTNWLRNTGFEQGVMVVGFTNSYMTWDNILNSGTAAESGTNGILFFGFTNAQGGLYQDVAAVTNIQYEATIRARKQPNFRATNGVMLKVEFRNSVTNDLGATLETNVYPTLTTNWQTFRLTSATAPNSSAWVRAAFLIPPNSCNPLSDSSRDLFVDNITLKPATGGLRLVFSAYDPTSGISRGTTQPTSQMNVSVGSWTVSNADRYVASESTADSKSPATTNTWKWFSLNGGDIDALVWGGTNLVTAMVPDADDDRVNDSLRLQDQRFGRLYVQDDDVVPPVALTNVVDQFGPFAAYAHLAPDPVGGTSGTNRMFEITDEELANVATEPLRIVFSAWDTNGVNRGRDTPVTNMNITVVNLTTNNVTNFNLAGSTLYTTNPASTSQWTFSSPFSATWIDSVMFTTSKVTASVPDGDNDRTFDSMWRSNYQFGFIRFADDDGDPPDLRSFGTTNPALQLYLGGDPGLGFSGSNVWWPGGIYTNITNADVTFRVTDGNLAGLSGSAPLDFRIWIYDQYGGVSRDPANSVTNTSLSIGSVIISNVANLVLSNSASAGNTKLVFNSTNYWRWTSFTRQQVSDLYDAAGHSNRLSMHAFNADQDRASDQEDGLTNLGWLVVNDDDTNKPLVGSGGVTNLLGNADLETLGWDEYHAYHWQWDNPDQHGDIWGNALHATNWEARSGTRAATIPGRWGVHTNLNGGWWQEVTNQWPSQTVWDAWCYAWNDTVKPWTSAYRALQIEFYDGPRTTQLGSNVYAFAAPGESWTLLSVAATSPANAAWVRFTFLANGVATGDVGCLYFDDAGLRPRMPLGIQIGNTTYGGSDLTTNAVYTVTDGAMGNVNSTNPCRLILGAYDVDSGLSRGTDGASTQTCVTVENWTTNNVTNYLAAASATATISPMAYNVWEWQSISAAQVQQLIDNGSNRILATLFDADDDRNGDRMTNAAQQYGWLRVVDDDTNPPAATYMKVNWASPAATNVTDQQLHIGSWQLQILMSDASGICTSWWLAFAVNFSLVNPAGITSITERGWDNVETTNYVDYNCWNNWAGAVSYTNVLTGTYAVVWSAADLDNDRDYDWKALTNSHNIASTSNRFLCIDDDTGDPTMPSNIVVAPSTWTNVNYFNVNFNRSLDASGVYQYRTSTNTAAPTSVTDGVALASVTVTNTIVPVVSNRDFEVGYDGLGVPQYPALTNGWLSFGSLGSTCQWNSAEHQTGSNSMRHVLSEGNWGIDKGRYTLCSQYVPINNPSDQLVRVKFSGWFKGNMAYWQWNRTNVAFLKAELMDSNDNITLQVEMDAWDPDPLNGSPLCGKNVGTWTNVILQVTNGPANTRKILFSTAIDSSGSALPATGYWDNLSVTVTLIDTISGGVIYTNAPEGSNRVWLFAVDDDDDRVSDRLKSGNTNYMIYYDKTAPLRVTNVVAVEGTNDDSSEIWLDWDPLPDGGGVNLSPWRTYAIFYTDESRSPTNTDPYVVWTNGYPSLANNALDKVLLTNLVFGTTYSLSLAGKDSAGNIGPLSTSVAVILQG